tara:strand:+ start:1422 stop:2153 length:732 start_codon:yes stop_codon:yes gene_type:complete
MKKNILIVGGTSGIIIPCLKSFIKKYNVYATYSKRDSFKNIPQNIIGSNKIKFIKIDFNSKNSEIIKVLKKNKIKADIIINTVGGNFGIKEYPYDLNLWQKSLDLNFFKHLLINNYFMKDMKKNNFGRILFFSGVAVEDPKSSITYSASKAMLENYVKKSALIFGKYNILINCIKTSIVAAKNNNWFKATQQKPKEVKELMKKTLAVEKIGKAEDFTKMIELVISEKNHFINGSILNIDGGIK